MIDKPNKQKFPRIEEAAARGLARQAALKADAQSTRDGKLAALEFLGLPAVADANDIAISQAVSLKRIADALQPTIVEHRMPTASEAELRAVLNDTVAATDIESLAGDMLNLTAEEIADARDMHSSDEIFAAKVRRLASAVLRKAEK
jgi:hypothetical protein